MLTPVQSTLSPVGRLPTSGSCGQLLVYEISWPGLDVAADHEVQKKNDQPIPAQQIIVRTSSGVLVAITQPLGQPLFVGQRVYIQGNGESAVVTPQ